MQRTVFTGNCKFVFVRATPNLYLFFSDSYWLNCEDPENERRPEVWDDHDLFSLPYESNIKQTSNEISVRESLVDLIPNSLN